MDINQTLASDVLEVKERQVLRVDGSTPVSLQEPM